MKARDIDGRTPLLVAADQGHAEVSRLLLDKRDSAEGVDLEARDRFGQTALSIAVRLRKYATTRILLSTGKFRMLSEDQFGRTPVYWAKELGCANMDDFFSLADGNE